MSTFPLAGSFPSGYHILLYHPSLKRRKTSRLTSLSCCPISLLPSSTKLLGIQLVRLPYPPLHQNSPCNGSWWRISSQPFFGLAFGATSGSLLQETLPSLGIRGPTLCSFASPLDRLVVPQLASLTLQCWRLHPKPTSLHLRLLLGELSQFLALPVVPVFAHSAPQVPGLKSDSVSSPESRSSCGLL